MAALHTLIKLYGRQIDERRKHLTALEEELTQLAQSLLYLQKEFLQEQEAARISIDAYFAYSNYAHYNQLRQQHLQEAIKALEKEIAKENEEIRRLFSEKKKYEIALEQRNQQIKKEEERRENIRMDEVGANQHRKQTEE